MLRLGTVNRQRHVFPLAEKFGLPALVIVPRLIARLLNDSDLPSIGSSVWEDTNVVLPCGHGFAEYRNVFTGEAGSLQNSGDYTRIDLSAALRDSPVALYVLS
jgi:maltooligosyltrehalose synthase